MRVSLRQAVLALLLLGLLGCAREAPLCEVCDRPIHPQVGATLTLAGGHRVHACCPRCALHYRDDPAHRVAALDVTDYAGGAALPLARAFLVEGSDETPCLHHPPVVDETRTPMRICYDRCMPSLIAFRDEAGARAFMAEHGGALRLPGDLPAGPGPSR